MRLPRIYQAVPLARGQTLELDAQATVHLAKVLRLRVGDGLRVFNGEGGEFAATVSELGRRTARICLDEYLPDALESPLQLVLLQGISRGERMDYTVQKAVELGVGSIVPVQAERTTVNLKAERRHKRRDHWQAVVHSACEQSGRNRVPAVAPVSSFAEAIAGAQGLKLVLHHRAATGLTELPAPSGPVTVLIGPEGGLTAAEISAAEAAGFHPLRLGPRVLRTETAALVSLAVLQWQWGDLGPGEDVS